MMGGNGGRSVSSTNEPEGFRTLSELEELAGRKLAASAWAYVQGGAGEERCLRANREAFQLLQIVPRAFEGRGEIDVRTRILGAASAVPFFLAPMAYQGTIHPDGEQGVARAASDAGVLATFSTLSTDSLEKIGAASGQGRRWFQLYHQPDDAADRALIQRAERAGYSAIMLTADTPVLGVRDRQARGGFAIDASVPVGNGPEIVPPAREVVRVGETYRPSPDAAPTWETLDRVRESTRLPIVVKGIMDPADARRCVDYGASGIVVSNHGGRQLDGAPASLAALPAIVEAVGSRTEVYLDGGVRRGSDVLIALALGAKAVGIGRPVLWALAVGGSAGVSRYLSLLTQEIISVMVLAGRHSISEIDRSLLAGPVG